MVRVGAIKNLFMRTDTYVLNDKGNDCTYLKLSVMDDYQSLHRSGIMA